MANYLVDYLDETKHNGYHFPSQSIRWFPIQTQSQNHSFEFMYGAKQNRVPVQQPIQLNTSGKFLLDKNYTFVGGCSLRRLSSKRLSPILPGISCSKIETVCDDEDFVDLCSSDLLVGLQIPNRMLDKDTRCYMHCHFDNNPEKGIDRGVMIALKFNDIRAVIQAHGYLDGCSQFVKVDLGFGDQVASGKRFSTVLTSTFPAKPTHPDQCFLLARLCSITEFERAACEMKSETKLKFLQGHISISIYSSDYWDDVPRRRWDVALESTSDPNSHRPTSAFDHRLSQEVECSEAQIYILSNDKRKFPCQKSAIKSKSSDLFELIKIHEISKNPHVLPMTALNSEAVQALITYMHESTLQRCKISCSTAISLIEAGRKYEIHGLEDEMSKMILNMKDPQWFDIPSLIKLFLLCRNGAIVDGDKIKFRIVQAFQMKRREEDTSKAVQNLFALDPDVAADLLMQALTICSKYHP